MEMIYAGTGSVRTPHWARDLFCIAGERLTESFTLRSGRQDGSDISFERGCEKGHGKSEIWLPWSHFNYSKSDKVADIDKYRYICASAYSDWDNLSTGMKKEYARCIPMILGEDLDEPIDFMVCYIPPDEDDTVARFAYSLATTNNIPIVNVGLYYEHESVYIYDSIIALAEKVKRKYNDI